ncbi:PREDICTED: auxin-responsive protein IAA26 [Tarenaya hassleriana]|uniref:auxin-responsive protein IAA26 n=1 Tax=Tarenaya hassleriana TaxID=28532 RepID=UPI00053C9885|nr:PREDICTED: auxin-responsive protein IAA26 [Tarenaya hassleriana]
MEGSARNGEICPKLLNLIPKDREWFHDDKSSHGCCNTEEKKLELRLGPPGGDEGCLAMKKNTDNRNKNKNMLNVKHETEDKSLLCLGRHFSPSTTKTTAVPHSSQKRTAPGPVVGWPPVRSFRKNLASASSSKAGNESSNGGQGKCDAEKPFESKTKGLFVKINMDGVPIGRKVDLNAYSSYEQLSSAVDKLFRGLLAAQIDSSGRGNKLGEERPITRLLDGNGEYTLTYEDNEGDKMLVGDVPWHMFVSSVKRLRVIKSSEVSSALTFGSSKQEKMKH